MRINGQAFRTIWQADAGGDVAVIDQTRLPFAFAVRTLRHRRRRCGRDPRHGGARRAADRRDGGLRRGAGAARESGRRGPRRRHRARWWRRARPQSTCVGRWSACGALWRRLPPAERAARAYAEAAAIAEEDVASCAAIGRHGLGLLRGLAHGKGGGASTCSPIATPAGSPPSTGAPRSRRSTRRTRPGCPCTSGSTRRGRATRGLAHRVRARRARRAAHRDRRQRRRPPDAAGRGRRLHRRQRPHDGDGRRRQQDRHVPQGARCPRQRRAVLCGAAVLDDRLVARRRPRRCRSRSDRRARSPTCVAARADGSLEE